MRRRNPGFVALALVVGACQAGTAATPPPSTGSAPPAAVSIAPTPSAAVDTTPTATRPVAMQRPGNLPTDGSCETEDASCLGILEANKTYTTKIFKPAITFSIPVAGWINQFDGVGDFGLIELDPAGDGVLFFRDPRATDASVGPGIDAIAAWLATDKNLAVTAATTVKLGGLSGVAMDVRTAAGATTDPGCRVQVCVGFLRGDDPLANDLYPWHWDWGTAGPEAQRLYLLKTADGTMAIVVDSVDGTTFESLIATWEKIAPTVKFS
jgi:hypothetical protein